MGPSAGLDGAENSAPAELDLQTVSARSESHLRLRRLSSPVCVCTHVNYMELHVVCTVCQACMVSGEPSGAVQENFLNG